MRLYRKKVLRQAFQRQSRSMVETRDAILWDVNESDRYCRVKIQGSDTLIYAHFPRNWKNIPTWCKAGNAVRIQHRSGVRGYIEVVGHGRAVPSAVAGGTARPTTPTGADVVLSGSEVLATDPATMQVSVNSGTYRINGTIYYLGGTEGSYIVMNDPAPMTMGSDTTMGSAVGLLTINDASAGYFRYDIVVVGTDGVIEVVEGTEATDDPTVPTTPSDHVLLATILVVGGHGSIEQRHIGMIWTAREPSYITITLDPESLTWTDPPPVTQQTLEVTITVYDQYDTAVAASPYWYFDVQLIIGDGDLYKYGVGTGTSLTITSGPYGSYATCTYQRPLTGGTSSPILKAELQGYTDLLVAVKQILLYDDSGNLLV